MIKGLIITVAILLSGALGAITHAYTQIDNTTAQLEQATRTAKAINKTLVVLKSQVDSTNTAIIGLQVEVTKIQNEVANLSNKATVYEAHNRL